MKKVGLLAAIAALLCGFLIYLWMDSVEKRVSSSQPEPPKVETVTVITAAQDIPAYSVITSEQLTAVQYPADFVPENALRSIDGAAGMYTGGMIHAGEIIYSSSVVSFEEMNSPLSYTIPEGMRAMTISGTAVTGVAGRITKGDLVDILAYCNDPVLCTDRTIIEGKGDENNPEAARIYTSSEDHYFIDGLGISINLLEGIEVLAVGNVNEEEGVVYSTLTLALTPEQCIKLNLTEGRAILNVALRPRGDHSEGSGTICTLAEVLSEGGQ